MLIGGVKIRLPAAKLKTKTGGYLVRFHFIIFLNFNHLYYLAGYGKSNLYLMFNDFICSSKYLHLLYFIAKLFGFTVCMI